MSTQSTTNTQLWLTWWRQQTSPYLWWNTWGNC